MELQRIRWMDSGRYRIMLSICKSAGRPGVKLRYWQAYWVKSYHAPTRLALAYSLLLSLSLTLSLSHTNTQTKRARERELCKTAAFFMRNQKNKYFIQVCSVNSIMHLFFDSLSFEADWMQSWWNSSRLQAPTTTFRINKHWTSFYAVLITENKRKLWGVRSLNKTTTRCIISKTINSKEKHKTH